MKKSISAVMTAICCLASLTSLTATAVYDVGGWTERDGDLYYEFRGIDAGLLIETDGTELTEEMLADFPACTGVMAWDLYAMPGADYLMEPTEIPGANAYFVIVPAGEQYELDAAGRKLLQEYDCLTSARLVQYCDYTFSGWDYVYSVETTGADVVLDATSIPELSEFTIKEAHVDGFYVYTLETPEDSAFAKEVSGEYLSYALYEAALEYGNALAEKYSEMISAVTPYMAVDLSPSGTEYELLSIWDTAGDLDTDGKIDASDAAELLALSAMRGATADGGYDPFTAEQKSAADLNGDTFCDAND
ncbi:MAG: hypothetical protein IJN57_12080, partial [Oscillospiraceae bacterium]|nr:hypothetical protein [Oscillospiraceae bacterium]